MGEHYLPSIGRREYTWRGSAKHSRLLSYLPPDSELLNEAPSSSPASPSLLASPQSTASSSSSSSSLASNNGVPEYVVNPRRPRRPLLLHPKSHAIPAPNASLEMPTYSPVLPTSTISRSSYTAPPVPPYNPKPSRTKPHHASHSHPSSASNEREGDDHDVDASVSEVTTLVPLSKQLPTNITAPDPSAVVSFSDHNPQQKTTKENTNNNTTATTTTATETSLSEEITKRKRHFRFLHRSKKHNADALHPPMPGVAHQ